MLRRIFSLTILLTSCFRGCRIRLRRMRTELIVARTAAGAVQIEGSAAAPSNDVRPCCAVSQLPHGVLPHAHRRTDSTTPKAFRRTGDSYLRRCRDGYLIERLDAILLHLFLVLPMRCSI